MKNYTITVNGNVYDVTVEETGSTSGTETYSCKASCSTSSTSCFSRSRKH